LPKKENTLAKAYVIATIGTCISRFVDKITRRNPKIYDFVFDWKNNHIGHQ